ncbi:MAG: hypothetical protein Kow0090_00530 [Myxococcota bacterium]
MKFNLFALLFLAFSSQAFAASVQVAVFPFAANQGTDSRAAGDAYNIFIAEAEKARGYDILSAQKIINILGEGAKEQVESCANEQCAAHLTLFVGAQEAILGSLTLVQNSYLILLKRINVLNRRTIYEFSATLQAGSPNDFENLRSIVINSIPVLLPEKAIPLPDEYAQKEGEAKGNLESSPNYYIYGAIASGVLAVVGVGLLTYGAIAYNSAATDRDTLKETIVDDRSQFDEIKDRGEKAALMVNIGTSVAAVGAVAGSTLLFLGLREARAAETRQEKSAYGIRIKSLSILPCAVAAIAGEF